MTITKPAVGMALPSIDLPLIGGGIRNLSKPRDGFDWQMTVVYRGKHCPVCTNYLKELNNVVPELSELGVDLLAVSADSQQRAKTQIAEVMPDFPVAYDLQVDHMKALGLYVSGPRNGIDVERPFAEPGLFVVNDSGKLQIADISNVPFARPNIPSLIKGLRFLRNLTTKFPINGTHI